MLRGKTLGITRQAVAPGATTRNGKPIPAATDGPKKMSNTKQTAHDLMPEAIAQTIPPLYGTEHGSDPVARVKWFTPDSSWSWFVTEFDHETRVCFGLVDGHETELGYFSLDEIEEVRGPMGLRVERDLYWVPTPLSQLQQELGRDR